MVKVLVIADDLTGALDTSVQFVGAGTMVIPYREYRFMDCVHTDTEVLVLHTNTRHCPADEAFEITRTMAHIAAQNGIRIIYKKTDSALRGNIGAELEGVLAGSGYRQMYFIPAFPLINRITVKGIQYIDGEPLAESVFRHDPIDPARESSVMKIIRAQSHSDVQLIEESQALDCADGYDGITVFDAASEDRMQSIARWLAQKEGPLAIAGCAGLARNLAGIIDINRNESRCEHRAKGMLIVSGSVNPMNLGQLDYAKAHGFETFSAFQLTGFISEIDFSPRQTEIDALLRRYERSGRLIIMTSSTPLDASDAGVDAEARAMESQTVADNLGKIVVAMYRNGFDGLVVVSGGDTLGSVITGVQAQSVEPLGEIEAGVVLSRMIVYGQVRYIVTKSGAFGAEDVYLNIHRFCCGGDGMMQAQ